MRKQVCSRHWLSMSAYIKKKSSLLAVIIPPRAIKISLCSVFRNLAHLCLEAHCLNIIKSICRKTNPRLPRRKFFKFHREKSDPCLAAIFLDIIPELHRHPFSLPCHPTIRPVFPALCAVTYTQCCQPSHSFLTVTSFALLSVQLSCSAAVRGTAAVFSSAVSLRVQPRPLQKAKGGAFCTELLA